MGRYKPLPNSSKPHNTFTLIDPFPMVDRYLIGSNTVVFVSRSFFFQVVMTFGEFLDAIFSPDNQHFSDYPKNILHYLLTCITSL